MFVLFFFLEAVKLQSSRWSTHAKNFLTDVFADGQKMSSAALVYFGLIDDVPNHVEKREPPITSVEYEVVIHE